MLTKNDNNVIYLVYHYIDFIIIRMKRVIHLNCIHNPQVPGEVADAASKQDIKPVEAGTGTEAVDQPSPVNSVIKRTDDDQKYKGIYFTILNFMTLSHLYYIIISFSVDSRKRCYFFLFM